MVGRVVWVTSRLSLPHRVRHVASLQHSVPSPHHNCLCTEEHSFTDNTFNSGFHCVLRSIRPVKETNLFGMKKPTIVIGFYFICFLCVLKFQTLVCSTLKNCNTKLTLQHFGNVFFFYEKSSITV